MTEDIRQYAFDRLARPKYRGIHLAQQNRLPLSKLTVLLGAVREIAGDQPFVVPPGDESRYIYSPDHRQYHAMLDLINRAPKISASFNSLKKNHFTNLERMELLNYLPMTRDSGSRSRIRKAVLTPNGIALIEAGAYRQSELFGEAKRRLLGPYADPLFELLAEVDSLNLYEIMLIASDLTTDLARKVELVRAYRRLKTVGMLQFHQELEDFCNSTHLPGVPKPQKRDWGNWFNQAEEIMETASAAVGFAAVRGRKQRSLQLYQSGNPNMAPFTPQRSAQVKAEALAWHDLSRRTGWELHHIYPIDYATCPQDLRLIDAMQNLLYLPKQQHNRIPKKKNRSVQLSRELTHVLLMNPAAPGGEPIVDFAIPLEVVVKLDNLPVMISYNQRLLTEVA